MHTFASGKVTGEDYRVSVNPNTEKKTHFII